MKTKISNLRRLDILGNGDCSSDREILTARLRWWREKLGYYSIFAAVPAILASHMSEARSDEAKKPEGSVAGRTVRLLERLNKNCSNPKLLKRQSQFLLPHQTGSFDLLTTLGGNDDCPGRAIPAGNYTAAAPYIDSGDTTGANNTVNRIVGYYYNYDAFGPDHVYSFTLTGRGPNPQIQVSTTSASDSPLVYIVDGTSGCPAGTGNTLLNWRALSFSSPFIGGTATLTSSQMNLLPLNVPLHLFVDSVLTDPNNSGPYTIRVQDVTITQACLNSIDCTEFFVRQQYLDFLNRQADAAGLAFWTNEIVTCGTDAGCIEAKRINASAAFFLSIEFQDTGYLVYRMYKASYGNLPGAPVPIKLNEFLPDTQQIGQGVVVGQAGWEQVLENNKQAFAVDFVTRSRFTTAYPTTLTPTEFFYALFTSAGVTPSAADVAAVIGEFAGAADSSNTAARARAVRRVAEHQTLVEQEFNKAFVLMQYFGYLRRNPNDAPEAGLNFDGYNFWLAKLNQFNGNFVQADMVKAFISSGEYRQRFIQP